VQQEDAATEENLTENSEENDAENDVEDDSEMDEMGAGNEEDLEEHSLGQTDPKARQSEADSPAQSPVPLSHMRSRSPRIASRMLLPRVVATRLTGTTPIHLVPCRHQALTDGARLRLSLHLGHCPLQHRDPREDPLQSVPVGVSLPQAQKIQAQALKI
jgi:hypothetical protein